MTFESALEARVHAIAPVEAATAGRVGWTLRLDGLPAVAMQVVADPRPQHMKGFQRVRPTSVQIDVYARTDAVAIALREHVIAGLVPAAEVGGVRFQRAMVTGVRSLPETEQSGERQRLSGEIARQSIDITFMHNG